MGFSDANFKGIGLKSELGGEKIAKILTSYPELSAEWLLLGEGDMLKTKRRDSQTHTPSSQPSATLLGDAALDKGTQSPSDNQTKSAQNLPFDSLIATITQQAEEIGRLKAQIAELERRLAAQP